MSYPPGLRRFPHLFQRIFLRCWPSIGIGAPRWKRGGPAGAGRQRGYTFSPRERPMRKTLAILVVALLLFAGQGILTLHNQPASAQTEPSPTGPVGLTLTPILQ